MSLNKIERCILKKFNRQHIKANIIEIVIDNLIHSEYQNMFLDYMVDNRNILLTEYDIFSELNQLLGR